MKRILSAFTLIIAFHLAQAQVPMDTAIDFSVKDIDGNTIELFPLLDEGKLVVIDFFNTACASCALYAPDFQASYEDFGENSSNVFFVSICYGDDNAGVAYFDSTYNLTHPSVSGSQGGGNEVHQLYQVAATPTVILINPEREIVEQHIWEPTQQNINDAIIAAGGSMVGIPGHDAGLKNLNVYPNPARDKISICFSADQASACHVEVYDITGSLVMRSDVKSPLSHEEEFILSVGHMVPGPYLIRLIENGKVLGQAKLLIR